MSIKKCMILVVSYSLLFILSLQAQQPSSAGMKVPEGIIAHRDLEYAKVGTRPLLLDIYTPEKTTGPLPLIVWIHGGAWLSGTKERPPALELARFGYVVVSINYRLSQEAIFPAQIHDCKAAIRWLRANAKQYNIDPKRIGVWGSSAGGHLVAMLGVTGGVKELEGDLGNPKQSSRVQAVCDWFGPSDLTTMQKQSLPGSLLNHDGPNSPESLLIGGPVQQNKDKALKASPISYVSKDDAPILIMHGDRDLTVPPGQSEVLFKALKSAGVDARFHIVAGAGHGGPGFNTPEIRIMVREFFDKYLK